MSHITDIKMRVHDIDALREAGALCGMELRKKADYAWWGEYVGDSHDYGELDPKDFGKCEYALGRINTTPSSGPSGEWEIAVVKAKDGEGYIIGADLFGFSGARLQEACGKGLEKLKHAYSTIVAVKAVKQQLALGGFAFDKPKDLGGGRSLVRAFKF